MGEWGVWIPVRVLHCTFSALFYSRPHLPSNLPFLNIRIRERGESWDLWLPILYSLICNTPDVRRTFIAFMWERFIRPNIEVCGLSSAFWYLERLFFVIFPYAIVMGYIKSVCVYASLISSLIMSLFLIIFFIFHFFVDSNDQNVDQICHILQ